MDEAAYREIYNNIRYSEERLGVPGIKRWGKRNYQRAQCKLGVHRHDGVIEGIIVTRGEKKYLLGKENICIRRGQVLFIPPDTDHQSADVYEDSGECYAIHLDPSVENLLFLCKGGSARMSSTLLTNCGRVIDASNYVFNLVAQCHQCVEQEQDPLYIASAMQFLLNCVLFEKFDPPQLDEDVLRAMEYISAHIEDKPLVSEMCRVLKIPKSTLQHKFSEATGEGLQEYISRERIKASLKILRQTRDVTETSAIFQFAHSSHYSEAFKKHMFVSPQQWLDMYPVDS